MDLQSAGIDFTASPELFGHLQNRGMSFLMDVHSALLRRFRFPFVFLLTCDRAEVIATGPVSIEAVERVLSLNPAAVRSFRYNYTGEEALRRLFLLSAGVLSPLFGEDTIQGQIADAMEASMLLGTSSPQLRKLLSQAISFSKRIHTMLNTRVFDSTIAEAVRKRLEGIGSVLMIGSGEGARAVAEVLLKEHSVTMTLRDDSKTFLIPPGALHIPYEKRREEIARHDAVISASSGLYHTLDDEDYPLVAGKILFDLSSPPDLPASFNAIRIPDLDVPLPERDNVLRIIGEMADKEVKVYNEWLRKEADAEDVRNRAEIIALSSLRRSDAAISSLALSPERERAFREALSENIRKAVISELFSRKS